MHFYWVKLALLFASVLASPFKDLADDDVTLDKRAAKKITITPTDVVGASFRGSAFDDRALIGGDQKRLQWIEFSGCGETEHLTWIHVAYGHGGVVKEGVYHGKRPADTSTYQVSLETARIIKVELVTWKKKVHFTYRTRIGHIKLFLSDGREFSCGGKNPDDKIITWYNYGKSLLYLSGTQGDEIDSLQGHFIPSVDY